MQPSLSFYADLHSSSSERITDHARLRVTYTDFLERIKMISNFLERLTSNFIPYSSSMPAESPPSSSAARGKACFRIGGQPRDLNERN